MTEQVNMPLTEGAWKWPTDPEVMWQRFIDHLHKESGFENKNFIGSIEYYKKRFMEANNND